MRILHCDDTEIIVFVPPCGSILPADYTATLTKANCPRYTLVVTLALDSSPAPQRLLRLALPAPAPARGTWTLSVKTPCGCYDTTVWLDTCAASALPGTHTPTRLPVITYCLPNLTGSLLTLGMVFGRNAAGTQTGIHMGTPSPSPFGAFLLPLPTPTPSEFALRTLDSDPLTIIGTLTTAPAGLVGFPWTLLDNYGREIVVGMVTAGAPGTATLEATLPRPLSCGKHYLIFG